MDVPHLRSDGVRATAQHPLHDGPGLRQYAFQLDATRSHRWRAPTAYRRVTAEAGSEFRPARPPWTPLAASTCRAGKLGSSLSRDLHAIRTPERQDQPQRILRLLVSTVSRSSATVLSSETCWASWFRQQTGSGSPTHRHAAPTATPSARTRYWSAIKPASGTAAGTPPGPAEYAMRRCTGHRSTATAASSLGRRMCGSLADTIEIASCSPGGGPNSCRCPRALVR